MIKPDCNDPIKVRRTLAFYVSLYAFLILPNLLVFYHALWATEVELLKSILTYIGVLTACTGPTPQVKVIKPEVPQSLVDTHIYSLGIKAKFHFIYRARFL